MSPTFEVKVSFEIQAPTGGARQVVGFTAICPRLTVPELEALGAEASAGGLDDITVAGRLLKGWLADVTDANGAPLPFTEANKATVLAVAGCATALVRAYRAALPRAAEGN